MTPGPFLIDDRRSANARTLWFEDPCGVIRAEQPADVIKALREVEAAANSGQWAVGFISFEAGYALEPRLAALEAPSTPPNVPLIEFHLFERNQAFSPRDADVRLLGELHEGHQLSQLRPGESDNDYGSKVDEVLELIRAGDIYQANITFPLEARLRGSALSLFAALRARQPVAHGAFLPLLDGAALLSLSPEMFLTRQGSRLSTRPMKGTIARGKTTAEDRAARAQLLASAKDRAENLMIVDLLRNDLARVTDPGSVVVSRLFELETYPTLHTLTSTVEGDLHEGTGFAAIMTALFPCGSVTGAPKIRAMEVIRDLEGHARGAYTGAIGFIAPDGDFSFNVAIRTATVSADGDLTYPVGAGIVADSEPASEYRECLLKAAVIAGEAEPFGLIETLAWERANGFAYFDAHLERLAQSATWFGFVLDLPLVRDALLEHVSKQVGGRLRVRLVLSANGNAEITSQPLAAPTTIPLQVMLAKTAVDAGDPYLRHKTTRRNLFERELSEAKAAHSAAEVLFSNQYGELTEGSWTSLFVDMGDGPLLTPPLEAGLLPGILRADLLAKGEAVEQSLTREDLCCARAIYMGNSVRGLMRAELISEEQVREEPQLASAISSG